MEGKTDGAGRHHPRGYTGEFRQGDSGRSGLRGTPGRRDGGDIARDLPFSKLRIFSLPGEACGPRKGNGSRKGSVVRFTADRGQRLVRPGDHFEGCKGLSDWRRNL